MAQSEAWAAYTSLPGLHYATNCFTGSDPERDLLIMVNTQHSFSSPLWLSQVTQVRQVFRHIVFRHCCGSPHHKHLHCSTDGSAARSIQPPSTEGFSTLEPKRQRAEASKLPHVTTQEHTRESQPAATRNSCCYEISTPRPARFPRFS